MNTERGKFILFEGIGGSGKSTQMPMAKDYLESAGRRVVITREPGGVIESEIIRNLIFKLKDKNAVNADHQVALFFAARNFWVHNELAPKISHGTDVLSDRSFPSTAAYQGYGEGADISSIEIMTKIIMGEYMPDGIILLDVSPEVGRNRKLVNDGGDPFDRQDFRYWHRVVNGYRQMASEGWCDVPWHIVNAERPIRQIADDVKEIIRKIVLSNI